MAFVEITGPEYTEFLRKRLRGEVTKLDKSYLKYASKGRNSLRCVSAHIRTGRCGYFIRWKLMRSNLDQQYISIRPH
jgi:hypothetical protein